MALESNLQADKITPSGLRKLTGLLILILTIIFIFLILNNIFKKEEFEPIVEDVITEEENVEDYDDFIFALPSGKLITPSRNLLKTLCSAISLSFLELIIL